MKKHSIKAYALRRMAVTSSPSPFSPLPFSPSKVAVGPDAIAFNWNIEPKREKI